MHARNKAPSPTAAKCFSRTSLIEGLEGRQLLSGTIVHPAIHLLPAANNGPTDGFTPTQIRHAYGFDKVKFNGAVGTGAGQTIAIVDSFRDPAIAKDLAIFDAQFGLAAPPSFKIMSQTGGAVGSIDTDPGWASEISLDVEWAHAIAPAANIDLFEADSDNLDDLMKAVDTARHAPGVSVVSMSWGGGEDFTQKAQDPTFTTPKGHTPVTFIAASGDEGSYGGAEYPASSPNVLSVGGTGLYTLDNRGTYANETPWSDSSGGISHFETTPAFQRAAQSNSHRTTPDVSYNADPSTGVAVYDSIADQGYVGWSVSGGTSAGAPQWGALIAIADQGRALLHKAALDGVANTLPLLYGTYKTSTYATSFNDIVSGWRTFPARAHVGYDTATGLGTPNADKVIAILVASGAPVSTVTPTPKPTVTSTGTVTTTGTGSGTKTSTGTSVTTAFTGRGGDDGGAVNQPPPGTEAHATEPASEQIGPPVIFQFLRSDSALSTPVQSPASASAGSIASTRPAVAGARPASADPAIVGRVAAPEAQQIGSTVIASAGSFAVHGGFAPFAISTGAAALALEHNLAAYLPAAEQFAADLANRVFAPAQSGTTGFDAIQASNSGAAADAVITQISRAAAPAAAAARAFFNIAPIDATALFSDAIASFAGQCADITAEPALAAPGRRALAITAGVLAIDGLLLGHWYAKRRRLNKGASRQDGFFRDGQPLGGAIPFD